MRRTTRTPQPFYIPQNSRTVHHAATAGHGRLWPYTSDVRSLTVCFPASGTLAAARGDQLQALPFSPHDRVQVVAGGVELIGAVTGLSTVSLLVLLHVCICAERSPPPPTPTLPGPCTNTGYLPDRQRWAVTFDNGIKAACASGQLARSDKPPPEGGSAAGGGCCQERWQDKAKDAAAACDHHHHHHAEPCAEGGADALCSSSHGSVETAVLAALRAGSGGGTGGGEDRPRLELPAADLALVELVARHGAVRGFPPSDSSAETCCMTSELCGNSMQGDWDAKAVALSARGVISQDPEPPAEPDGWPLKDAGARLAGRWAALIPVLKVPPPPGPQNAPVCVTASSGRLPSPTCRPSYALQRRRACTV